MEINEEKPTEEQQVREMMIPVFTVLKNGAILKNIFVVNSRDGEVEEILLVGRHPDCDILLTHPSISRFHLQIRSLPSRQKLFVTDLSSVHGTWIKDQKLEPDACVEVKEGDVIRIGGSTRIYRLHWIPLSRAYDIENPFVSPLDTSTVTEQEEENKMLEAENLEVAHQAVANTALGDDGEHLDVTSEGSGSTVPSDSEDTYNTTREISLPLASPSVLTLATDSVNTQKLTKWDLNVVQPATVKPSSCCTPSKQQSGGYPEGLVCSELEVSAEAEKCSVREDGGLYLNVFSEMMVPNEDEDPYLTAKETSSFPLPRDSIETEKLHLTDNFQASPELAIDITEANAENPSSGCSPRKGHIEGCFEVSGFTAFELASEAEILSFCQEVSGETEFVTKEVMEASVEPLNQADIRSHVGNKEIEVSRQVIAVSPNSSPQAEQLLTEDAQSLLGSEFKSEVCTETISENLHQRSNEVTPADDQNRKQEMNRETENIFEGSSLCFSVDLEQSFLSLANLKFETEISIGSERSEESNNLSETAGEGNTDKEEVPFSSNFAAETCEDTKPVEEMASYYTKSQENPTQKRHAVRDDALSEIDSSRKGKAACVELLEASDSSAFEFTAEVEILSHFQEVIGKNRSSIEKATEASAEPLTKAKFQSHKDNGETDVSRKIIAVSPNSFLQTEETVTGDAKSPLRSEVAIETDSEDLHRKSKISLRHKSAVSDCLFAGNAHLSRINTEDMKSLCLSWQPLAEREVMAQSEIWSEVNQSKKIETRKIECEGNTDKGSPIPSTLAAKKTGELPSDCTGSHEKQTPQTNSVGDGVLSKIDGSRSYSRRLKTCNIWSRSGKAASVLQVQTSSSKGKQKHIGNEPKAQVQSKQALSEKSKSLTVHHGAEKLEPEIFTPDKENFTSSCHMLKRLQDVGDIKDSKCSSKLSGKSCSSKSPLSISIVTSGALTDPEIFTPDKENLTPNSHMLKRLREIGEIKESKGSSSSKATRKPFFDTHVEENKLTEEKPNIHSLSSKSNVNHDESVARAPFQALLEKSSSHSQSYTVASSAASARNNISRGIRSSLNLSDGKRKMKWTIVLDTGSLLDKESRKPLHLLQGLKGTHLVVPTTVLKELNETKRIRSLLFRRRAEIASSALDWIEECKVNAKWWIQLQSPSPQSNGSAFHWNHNNAPEMGSPTSEDRVLECALLYRNRNSHEKLVLLSNDASLKVKAMAEGVICETAQEFYESLVNPLSERFMWRESLARGRTWSHVDDVVRYSNNRSRFLYRRKSTSYNGRESGEASTAAKGLKLILLHNYSHYGNK